MGPDDNDIVCSETVTNGHQTVRVRMRQDGEVIVDCKQKYGWQITQFYGKGRNLRLVLRPTDA